MCWSLPSLAEFPLSATLALENPDRAAVTPIEVAMPRDGANLVADLIGKIDMLRVECGKCGRSGRYRIATMPADKALPALLAELTTDCPRRQVQNFHDQCGACFPDLPKVL